MWQIKVEIDAVSLFTIETDSVRGAGKIMTSGKVRVVALPAILGSICEHKKGALIDGEDISSCGPLFNPIFHPLSTKGGL